MPPEPAVEHPLQRLSSPGLGLLRPPGRPLLAPLWTPRHVEGVVRLVGGQRVHGPVGPAGKGGAGDVPHGRALGVGGGELGAQELHAGGGLGGPLREHGVASGAAAAAGEGGGRVDEAAGAHGERGASGDGGEVGFGGGMGVVGCCF